MFTVINSFLTIHFTYICFINTIIKDITVKGDYIVFPQGKEPWLNASRLCKTRYKGHLLDSVEGSMEKTECLSKYSSDIELWSRKGLLLTPFISHEGCFGNLESLDSQRNASIKVGSVGECYRQCENKTKSFGIQNDTCHCISDQNRLIIQQEDFSLCRYKCKSPTSGNLEYCGGPMVINLYGKMQRNILRGGGNRGKCAAVDCSSTYHLTIQDCGTVLKYVCSGKIYFNIRKVNFTTASSLCMEQNKTYLSPNISPLCDNSMSQLGSSYWLDVRRYFAPSSEIPIQTGENEFKCGYFLSGISANMGYEDSCISKPTERGYACRTDRRPTQENVTYCSFDIPKKTTTKDKTSTPADSSSSYGISFQSQGVFQSSNLSNTVETTKGYIDVKSMNTSNSTSTSAIIGTIVGIIVIACVVVAFTTFFVLRRRKLKQNEQPKAEGIKDSNESRSYYQLEAEPRHNSDHMSGHASRHYFILEANTKPKINLGPEQEDKGTSGEMKIDEGGTCTVYEETGNDVYDLLNKRRKKQTDNEDVYQTMNRLSSDNDEYQHIRQVKEETSLEDSSDYAKFNEEQYATTNRDN